MLRVTIHHNIHQNDSVLYTPFHRWEHLFVNYLKQELRCFHIDVLGLARDDLTEILLMGVCIEDTLLKKVEEMLRKFQPRIEECIVEISVINSELAGLSQLYKKTFNMCENGEPLSYEEMLEFKSKAYDWRNLSVSNTNILKVSENYMSSTMTSPQRMLADYRSKMLDSILLQKTISLKQCFAIKEKKYSFSLLLLNLHTLLFVPEVEKQLKEFDHDNGFLEKVVKRSWGGSYILWPSFEVIENTPYWILFCNVRKKDIVILADMILEKLMFNINLSSEEKNEIITTTRVLFSC